MDEVLRAAMEPVLRDLDRAGLARPHIEDHDWTDDPGNPSAMLWGADGSGQGVSVTRRVPESERVAMVADQVQDWAIEELWGRAPTNWPRCPRHPENHPMTVATRDAVAVWTCPTDKVVVGAVGRL